MKLRLTGGGFEHYNGQMGLHFFEDGLSIGDVLARDAIRIANVIGAEWEDGTAANVGQMYIDNYHTQAPTDQEQRDAANPDVPKGVDQDAIAAAVEASGKLWTEAELAAIADKEGIAGLREIADPLSLKGNSIRGLIDAIMKAAGKPVEAA